MATIPAFGARNLPATYYPATQKTDGKAANAGNVATGANTSSASALQKAANVASPLSLSNDALDMQKRVAALGNATVDFAESFVNSFTQALFGDDAKGATIDFDAVSLEASSSYALGMQQTSGANGVRTLAGLSMTDSSHFIGKGTITTADGRKFDFEVEVKYDFQLDAAASQTTAADDSAAPLRLDDKTGGGAGLKDLPTVQLPNIDFPGTLADLFQLIGRDLHSALGANGEEGKNGQAGTGGSSDIDRNTLRGLSLRLLNLVDSKAADTYTAPSAADKAKSAAAYGEQAAPAASAADATDAFDTAPAPTADTSAAAATAATATAPEPSDIPGKPDAAA